MSITQETLQSHADDPAVLCCRTEEGTVLSADNFEDPAIFADLEDSGLLTIPKDVLKLGQIVGAKLSKTLDALTPLTADVVTGLTAIESTSHATPATEVAQEQPVQPTMAASPTHSQAGVLKLFIGEGKDITLEIPMGMAQSALSSNASTVTPQMAVANMQASAETAVDDNGQAKKMRSLTKRYIKIDKVELAAETKIEGSTLYIRKTAVEDAIKCSKLVKDVKLEIITKEDYGKYSETIMDVQPIATKEGDEELGSGATRVLDGAVFVVTGTDENGVQIGEFGSSEGEMDKNIMWNRPGCPDFGDILIKTQVTIAAGTNMERPGPLAAHKASDVITSEIRLAMKALSDESIAREEQFEHFRRPGKQKVVIVKEIMGQGAMHDNLILPFEPVGVLGAKPNVDLGNLPVMLSPLEVLDGGVHALTCIGPASKEMSRHYFREPLVIEAMQDESLDLCGVIFVGSPQINSEKFYVSKRLGMMIEGLDVDGAFITTEGFGNNHIDFAAHHQEVGQRGIPVVGFTFSAVQGALVTGNVYMKYMIDNNKSKQGIENEILGNNTLCQEDAIRGIAMLKAVMNGEEVKAAERNYNASVKEMNVDAIEETDSRQITRVKNEQTLEKSKKRREIYEVE